WPHHRSERHGRPRIGCKSPGRKAGPCAILTHGGSMLVRRRIQTPSVANGPERGSTGGGGRPRSFPSGPPFVGGAGKGRAVRDETATPAKPAWPLRRRRKRRLSGPPFAGFAGQRPADRDETATPAKPAWPLRRRR